MDQVASGVPMRQPSASRGAGGASFASPSGAPASTHAAIVEISWLDRWRSFFHAPTFGSACQGGMRRLTTTSLICLAEDFAFSYLRSEKGPMSPGRWHSTQRFWKIGSTSLWYVTLPDGAAPAAAGLPATFSTAQPGASVAAVGGALPASRASIASTR